VITAEQFFRENPEVTRVKRFQGNNYERKLAIERALKLLGKPYNLINFNCEHFANYVQSGNVKSDQLGWGFVLLGVFVIAALARCVRDCRLGGLILLIFFCQKRSEIRTLLSS